MTDKEIIIDGVDVSGCKNFSCGKCEEENKIPKTINHFTADCRMYPNCYFKQLARKTQECEKYEQLFDELDKRVSNCIKIYDCIIVSKIVKDIINKAKGEGNEDT